MKITEIKAILDATVLAGEDQLEKSVVGAGGADLMADVLSALASGWLYVNGLRELDGSW